MSQEEINILISATDEASSEIADASDQIESSLNEVNDSVEQVSSSTQDLTVSTNELGDAFTQASSQANEVNASSDQIESSLNEVNDSVEQVSSSTQDLTVSTNELGDAFTQASSQANEVNASSDQIESSLNEVNDSVEQVSSSTQDLTVSTNELGDAFTQASSQADEVNASYTAQPAVLDDTTSSLKTNAMAVSTLAMSGGMLVMSISNIEDAQVSLQRAQLMEEKAANSVTLAQQAYTEAVDDYGPSSQQAVDAANKLSLAQQTQQLDAEKVSEAQRNLSNDYMNLGIQAIPMVIGSVTALSTLTEAWPGIAGGASGATEGLSDAMDFLADNPVVLVITGIALLAVGLYEAYEHCAPFRDAVNEIGSVLEGDFMTALDDIKGALNFLWNDVLVPIGDFLKDVFVADINVVMDVIKPLIDAVNTISQVGSSVGGAVGGALKTIGLAEGGIVSSPTFALIGEEGPEAVIPLGENFGDALGDMTGGAALGGSVGGGGGGAESISVNMTTSPQISIGSLSSNASLQDILDALTQAVNAGMASSFVDAVNKALAERKRRRS